MGPFKARRSVAAVDVRLAPFIRQPALAYGLFVVLRPMLAGPFGVSAATKAGIFSSSPKSCLHTSLADNVQ